MDAWMAGDHDGITFLPGTAEAIGAMTIGGIETGKIATGGIATGGIVTGTTSGDLLAMPNAVGTAGTMIVAGVTPLTGGVLAGTDKSNGGLRRFSVRYASACRLVGLSQSNLQRQAEAYRTLNLRIVRRI